MSAEAETLKHIRRVAGMLGELASDLICRADVHDKSKLESPEAEVFEEFTAKLKGTTYGSDEYKSLLASMKPALDHHYEHNTHHPEHYGYLECNGCFKHFDKDYENPCDACGYGQFQFRPDIGGMNLLDLIEMLADWKAATERHADGSLAASIELNQKRFGYTDELKRIIKNTANYMGWLDTRPSTSN